MAFSSISPSSEEAVFFTANLSGAYKASSAAYKNANGYGIEEVGNNTICVSFSGSLDGSAFSQTTTKFGVCAINEGNNHFGSMIDGSARKPTPQPAHVLKEALKKFLSIWDNSNLHQQVAGKLAAGKTVLFTGHSIGGAIATLATLAILEKFGKGTFVSCITFGFPLIGDEVLARAVRRQQWANHFCHVVSRGDIFSRVLFAPCITVARPLEALLPYWQRSMEQMNDDDTDILMEEAPPANVDFPAFVRTVQQHACAVVNYTSATNMDPTNKLLASLKPAVKLSPYRPFGYYVFFSDKGGLWVESVEAVFPILYYSLATAQPSSLSDHIEYGKVSHAITNMAKLEGLSNLALSQAAVAPTSAMEAQLVALGLGVQNTPARLALRAAGELENKLKENLNKLQEEMGKLEAAGHMNKLNEYRKRCRSQKGNNGYYDTFKEHKDKEDFQANLNRLNLAGFYDRLEDMVENHQLSDDFQCNEDWITRGTEYRLLVEPLDIANYYRLGKHEDSGHYLRSARPRRYKALEKWLKDRNNKITEDSCFWAHVEETSWYVMSNATENLEAVRAKCEQFQNYVKGLIDRKELCVGDVVMGESSFRKWWNKFTQLPQVNKEASPLYPIFTNVN